jgi:hypothetical protein
VWEKADKMAGDSLSGLVTSLLRRYVDQRDAASDRIVVEIEDREGNLIRKAFTGRTLVQDFLPDEPGTLAGYGYFAAQGARAASHAGLRRAHEDVTDSFQTYKSCGGRNGGLAAELPLGRLICARRGVCDRDRPLI